MSIEGRIAIDVSFADTDTSSGVQAIKKIQLVDTTAYTTGKVAIVTGTCGTAGTFVLTAPTTYRNASGQFVSFANVSRVAFSASGGNLVRCYGANDTFGQFALYSRAGQVAASEAFEAEGGQYQMSVVGTAGTASYTLVLYGT